VIEEGAPAPDLELQTDEGETLRLSDLRGKPVVLFFYPKDETRGCTTQVCGLRDVYPDLTGRAHVFGVSIDDAEAHRSFRANHSLPFPLVVDEGNRLADAFGIDRFETEQWGSIYRRQTVVLDEDGVVMKAMPEVDAATHADDVLAVLEG
jgi:thioredoxin-dependent peroxiredoxin